MRLGRDGIAGLIGLAVSLLLLPAGARPAEAADRARRPGLLSHHRARVHRPHQRGAAGCRTSSRSAARARLALRRSPAGPPRAYGLVAAAFLIVAVYIALLPLLGFRIATALFVAAFQLALERPRTPAPVGDARRHSGRHLGADLPGVRDATCWCCCRAAPGRAGEPCSICSATASSPSCSGSTCCRCSSARSPAWSAAPCRASPSP